MMNEPFQIIKHPTHIMLTIPIYVNILFIHFDIQLANFDLLHFYFDLLIFFHATYVFKPFTLLFWHETFLQIIRHETELIFISP